MAPRSLVEAHRRDLRQLTDLAASDLAIMFRRFKTADAARDGLIDILPPLVGLYGSAATTLAADWYDDLRDAAGARGRFRAIPADLPDAGRTEALARWGVSPLFQAEPDFPTTLTKVSGGLQRIIANADRETVAASTVADKASKGWTRMGSGRCDWCRERIGVFYTDPEFNTHDDCGCVSAPEF